MGYDVMTREQIELIKDKLDIVDVIGQSISLTNTGGGIFKGATNAGSKSGMSLNVDQNLQLFIDWSNNGVKGDVYNWIAYENHLDIKSEFPKIINIAAELAGIELKKSNYNIEHEQKSNEIYTFTTAVAEYYHACLTEELRKFIFETWGITDETIDRLKIGFAPVDDNLFIKFKELFTTDIIKQSGLVINTRNGWFSFFNGRIMFPYWKNGKAVYFIGRKTEWTPETKYEDAKYKKQLTKSEQRDYISEIVSNNYFYGEDTVRGTDTCVITEGVTDCIMALQSGIPCISPVTVRFRNKDHEKILSVIGKITTIIICNDNEDNEAGFKGAMDTAEYLDHNGKNVKLIELPKSKNVDKIDMAEYLRDHSKEEFDILIKKAKPLLTIKLSRCQVSEEPLDNILAATEFIKNELNDQPISYKTIFTEQHLKKHFSFSSSVVRELISEIKAEMKERKKTDAEETTEHVDADTSDIPDNIKEEARKIIYVGDPVKKIIDTHANLHVGDEPLARALLVSVGIQCVKNSDGIHPKVSGDSGKGKTHCCKAMLHLIPKKHRFATTLSDKAIYYMDIPEGAVIFSDDVDLSDSLQGVIKRATSNYQDGDTYTTIDKNRDKQELTIPPRVAWWLTSVDDDQSLQLLNRQFGGGVDESPNQDDAVLNFQKQLAISGQINLPENDDVQICRCIIQDMKNQLYTVLIPYADDLIWIDKENRRNFPIFLDIIKAFAVLRHRQRYHTVDGMVIANIDDFNDAKDLYIGRAKNQGTKLTDTELRFCNLLNGAGEVDYNYLQKKMGVSQGRISQIINGKGRGDSGLVNKLKGLVVEKQSIKTDSDTTVQKTVCSLHGFKPLDHYQTVITLKPGAEDMFKRYYPDITRTLPEKNALPYYYITNITYYNRICSNKVIKGNESNEKCVYNFLPEKGNIQGNKVITPQPIAKEQGNNGGNTGVILPDQLKLMKHLRDFKQGHYKTISIVNTNPDDRFTQEFVDAYSPIYNNSVGRVTRAIDEMNRRGWE